MNPASWIAIMIVLVIVVLVIRNMIRDQRNGKCSCGCSSCKGTCPHGVTPVRKKRDGK